jgi:hypothetical protein
LVDTVLVSASIPGRGISIRGTEKKGQERGLTGGRIPAKAVLEFVDGMVPMSGDSEEDEDDEQTATVNLEP